LGAAVLHVLTPRILFPDKPATPDDTTVTAYYTDLPTVLFAHADTTSISIGYLGELYIDFGIWGALVAVSLMGVAFGRCYCAIRDYPGTPTFVNYGLCMMIVLQFSAFETALIKMLGAVVMVLASALALQRVIWPVLVDSTVIKAPGHPPVKA
jgi:hypothetical protein